MKLLSSFLLLSCGGVVDSLQQPQPQKAFSFVAKHAAAACIAGSLLLGQPSFAISDVIDGPLAKAIVDASDATYPVLKSLTAGTVSPLATKITSLLTKKIAANKLTIALDSGANALLSIPDDNLEKFTATVKASYEGVSKDSCSAVPLLPVDAVSTFTSSEAFSKLDASKVSQVTKKIASLTQAVPSTAEGICLPASKEGLEQLWIGQTELTLKIPRAAKQELVSSLSGALKSIPNAELLRILPEAKKITKGVDAKTAKKFEMAGENLDKVLKQDARFKSLQVN
jgi:hypothetical protein